jgi:hypothetical protein
MKATRKPAIRKPLLFLLLISALGAALLLMSRRLPGFGEWYARRVFPFFPYTLGRLAGLVPLSLFETAVFVLAAVFLLLLLRAPLLLLGRRRPQSLKAAGLGLLSFFLKLGCFFSALFLLFVLTCGINYHRDTFALQTGLNIRESSVGELRQLYRLLVEQVDALGEDPGLDEPGSDSGSAGAGEPGEPGSVSGAPNSNLVSGEPGSDSGSAAPSPPGFPAEEDQEINRLALQAMKDLSGLYAGLIDDYPRAKPVYFSEFLSRCQLGGFYSCFTMEANYNQHMPQLNKPFTLCHELAHLSGFAREDEANFVGYLGCLQSGDPYFRYSGSFYALRYVLNALYGVVPAEEYQELYLKLPEWLRRDLTDNRLYWQAYEGKTSEIYWAANDSFLRANDQTDGMQSYGRMVDLLLAYYRDRGELERYYAGPEPQLPEVNLSDWNFHSVNVLLADRATGRILFSKNGDKPAEPASVTKILTAITAIELIEDLDAQVTMQAADFTGLAETGASVSGFVEGETVSYRDLLYTLMLISGCDSAYALANNLSGSLPAFAARMNENAARLGLSASHFVDPSGLTAPGHYTTAEDTVKILDYALKNPLFRQIFESRTYTIPPTNRQSQEREIRNAFFSRLSRDFEDGYMANDARLLGGKTGFTDKAGLCLAAWGEYQDREYLAVIFGGPGTNRTPQYNFMDVLTLFGAL